MRMDKSLALYRKETANSVKLAVPHMGICPSGEDFERIALKILRRRDLEDIDPETLNNHLETLLCFLTDSDDEGRGRGLKTDDFGTDQDANGSNIVNTIYGAAPYQTRGDSRQRKGKGHQSAMQGDQHAGRGSSHGGGCTGKHAAKGDGNNSRSTGKAGRGVICEEANTANPDMPSA
ncbi:MAG: hypothetical protein FRX49_13778 [Trebouxia sp. A1-2]|nr:MAG: hypothetical protein FRX49_13810 [Trebouxia sp. A1-2]KAA6412348.1 MAG: hypothetical protein FRX49_13778 [Trebouxia sp. A1-2]